MLKNNLTNIQSFLIIDEGGLSHMKSLHIK